MQEIPAEIDCMAGWLVEWVEYPDPSTDLKLYGEMSRVVDIVSESIMMLSQ